MYSMHNHSESVVFKQHELT